MGKRLLKAHITFIPKIDNPKSASDFRPISILPHIVRVLQRIIDSRLQTIKISEEQVGFRKMDGCSFNNMLLKGIFVNSKKKGKPLSLAWLDMRKAFDYVSHQSLIRALIMY
ncbi:unnamed protein product [Lepeophtheirus salmonis]|uniref:(salmon louse) hypothetical protein n=1 Tax=Lepeophtheirus salmonis TaxID=72036 RepID=A0A7R8H3J2_LEPSM|nr:unnamed protein product [Lepeophtheirus salmonis]CAF2846739.1 unnamed protein product [Lepeophtheirus salmonis]